MFANIEIRYERRYFFSFVWALVLAADLICVSFFLAGERNLRRYTVNDFASEVIAEFAEAKKQADVSVVMLGNSRLRHAATFGFHPAELVTLPDGRKLAGVQFALNAARFELYEWFSHRLLQAQPDVLIIQNSVISNALGQGPTFLKVSEIVFSYYYNLLVGVDERKEWWDDRLWILKDCNFAYNKANANRRIQFMEKDAHSLGPENQNYKMAQDFIRQMRMQGTKIVVISVLPYMQHFDKQGVPLDILDFHGLGYYPTPEQLLPGQYNKVMWATYEAPENGTRQFCDDVHFNDDGRAAFMNWLLQNIEGWVPVKP